MDILLWITISFITIGFVVLTSMKRDMESKLALIIGKMEDEETSAKAKSIIWWIMSATAWGIVSILLIVWCFHLYYG